MAEQRDYWCRPGAPLSDLAEILSLLMPGGRKEAVLCQRPNQTPWIEVWLVWEGDDQRPAPDRYYVASSIVRKMAMNGWLTAVPPASGVGQRFVLNAIGQSAWWKIADELEESLDDQERYLRLQLRRYGVRF